MNKVNAVVAILVVMLVIESATIVSFYTSSKQNNKPSTPYEYVLKKTIVIPYGEFNQPISNDSEYRLDEDIEGSWAITIQGHLAARVNNQVGSEAQVAIAPEYPSENLSIPTIIVQERGDGLLRIEYFAQDWENTFGLVLYNSTSPNWLNGNVTLRFTSYGPPVPVNPQIAPYPNGNLTITVGDTPVVKDYPIAWATLSSFYIYGLKGSSFTAGTLFITVYGVKPKG